VRVVVVAQGEVVLLPRIMPVVGAVVVAALAMDGFALLI
jgi:hypothetical protein